jgi:hypothetical protein
MYLSLLPRTMNGQAPARPVARPSAYGTSGGSWNRRAHEVAPRLLPIATCDRSFQQEGQP